MMSDFRKNMNSKHGDQSKYIPDNRTSPKNQSKYQIHLVSDPLDQLNSAENSADNKFSKSQFAAAALQC